MGTRTVRLDEEAERTLREITEATGLTVSAALKRGLMVLHEQVAAEPSPSPYDVYARLDLGPGGYAVAPASRAKQGIRDVVKGKRSR